MAGTHTARVQNMTNTKRAGNGKGRFQVYRTESFGSMIGAGTTGNTFSKREACQALCNRLNKDVRKPGLFVVLDTMPELG